MRSESPSQRGRFRIISAVIIVLAALRASCHELPSQLALRLAWRPPGYELASAENSSRIAYLVWSPSRSQRRNQSIACITLRKKKNPRDGYYSRSPTAYRVFSRSLGFREYRVNPETYGLYNCGGNGAVNKVWRPPRSRSYYISVLLIQLHYESPQRVPVAWRQAVFRGCRRDRFTASEYQDRPEDRILPLASSSSLFHVSLF